MGATGSITGGLSIFDSGMGMINSIFKNQITNTDNDISSAYKIADVLNQGQNQASDMRTKAMSYDNDAANIRRELQDNTKVFDEKTASQIGSIKNSYSSAGVTLSGSALNVIASTEQSVARQRMARQQSADSEAMERELMADQLRLGANFTISRSKDAANRININNEFAESDNNINTLFNISGSMFSTGENIYKDFLKEMAQKNKEKNNYDFSQHNGVLMV